MMEYGHGGDIYRNRNVELDFSVNVNPLGMPNFVWEAAQRSIAFCTGYPDSSFMSSKNHFMRSSSA